VHPDRVGFIPGRDGQRYGLSHSAEKILKIHTKISAFFSNADSIGFRKLEVPTNCWSQSVKIGDRGCALCQSYTVSQKTGPKSRYLL